MSSFYGGPAGLSFQLQEYANYTAMQAALNTSLIGSYAIINYYNGNYADNVSTDAEANYGFRNSEFYRCDYINNKHIWTCLGKFQGITPQIVVNEPIDVLAPLDAPTVQISTTSPNSPERPVLTVGLPRAARWLSGSGEPSNGVGAAGDLYIDSVAPNKLYIKTVIGWSHVASLRGDTGATGPRGEQGVQGPQGEKGDTGATPQLSVAGVTTGDAGTNANVTLGGTAENPTLSFTIPRGDTGATGATGPKGDPGTVEIIAAYDISTTNANNTVAYISNQIEGQIGYMPPGSGQVIAVNWTDSADSSITLAYWYYKIDGNWARSLLTGNAGSLLIDEEAASSTNKAYTARYVSAALADIYTKTEADNKYLTKVSLPIIQSNEIYTNVYCSGGQAQWDAWLATLETEEE